MKTIAKWGCSLASCLFCGVLGAVGATVASAAARHQSVGRMLYVALLLAFTLLAWALFNMPTWIDSVHYVAALPSFRGCASNSSTSASDPSASTTIADWLLQHEFGASALSVPERLCYGSLSVLRVMMALAGFHVVLALVTVGATSADPTTARYELQHSWWSIKLFLLGVGLVATFLAVDDALVLAYYWVAFVGSLVFILVQILLLVEFAHRTTLYLAEGYRRAAARVGRPGRCAAGCGMMLVVVLAYAIAGAFFSMAFVIAASQQNCSVAWTAASVTLALAVAVTLGAIAAHRSARGGLAPAAIVVLYCAYLTWSGLTPMALRDSDCMPVSAVATSEGDDAPGLVYVSRIMGLHDVSRDAQHFVLLGTALAALLYATVRTSARVAEVQDEDDDDDERDPERISTAGMRLEEDEENDGAVAPSRLEPPAIYNFSLFHFIFALAACYATMVLLGWNPVHISSTATTPATTTNTNNNTPSVPAERTTIFVNHTTASLWIKTLSAWFTLALYMWTACAPLVCRHCKRNQPPQRVAS
jgi:hypothetical protein